jgi:hypothetical protein
MSVSAFDPGFDASFQGRETAVSLTSFRHTVAAEIATIVGVGLVVDGRVEGPLEQYDMVCSWPLRIVEFDEDVNLEDIYIAVRVLRAWNQERQPEVPFDPTRLETDAELIQTGAYDIQASAGPWLWRPQEFAFDLDEQRLDVAVYAQQPNLFAQA